MENLLDLNSFRKRKEEENIKKIISSGKYKRRFYLTQSGNVSSDYVQEGTNPPLPEGASILEGDDLYDFY